jgi:hypothetical protein
MGRKKGGKNKDHNQLYLEILHYLDNYTDTKPITVTMIAEECDVCYVLASKFITDKKNKYLNVYKRSINEAIKISKIRLREALQMYGINLPKKPKEKKYKNLGMFEGEDEYHIWFNNGFYELKFSRNKNCKRYYNTGWIRGRLEKEPNVETIDDMIHFFEEVLKKNKDQKRLLKLNI